MSKTGDVRESSRTFQWEFLSAHLRGNKRKTYFSPSVEFANGIWYLAISLYPSPTRESFIRFYLVRIKSLCLKHVISYKFSIKDKDGLDFKTCEGLNEEFVGNEIESGRCLEEKVYKLSNEHLAPKGVLTWSCTVSWERCFFAEAAEQTTSLTDSEVLHQRIGALEVAQQMMGPSSNAGCEKSKILWETLIHNLKDLFLNQRKCDVTIRVQGQEFQAHRVILEARSTVFAAMFEHDMAENRSGVVDIADTQPDMFRNILLYMYSGEVEEFSTENVFEFYALAEKYNLEDLKQECVKFIERSLSVETICEVLVLVDKYDQKQMKEFSIAFLKNNMSDVLISDKWKKLEAKNILLVVEVLKSMFVTVPEK